MAAAPAPMATPVVNAPRSTERTHSRATGPGWDPTNKPRPKPTSSGVTSSPSPAGAPGRPAACPTVRRPPPSRPSRPTSARAWADRAPRVPTCVRPPAPRRRACRGASAPPGGSPAAHGPGRWRSPRRAARAARTGCGGCRPTGRRRPRPQRPSSGQELRLPRPRRRLDVLHAEQVEHRHRRGLDHPDDRLVAVVLEVELHPRGVLVGAGPPEDEPARLLHVLHEAGAVAGAPLAVRAQLDVRVVSEPLGLGKRAPDLFRAGRQPDLLLELHVTSKCNRTVALCSGNQTVAG